jgi:hypothetical protein
MPPSAAGAIVSACPAAAVAAHDANMAGAAMSMKRMRAEYYDTCAI